MYSVVLLKMEVFMKKRIVILCGLLALLFLFSSCVFFNDYRLSWDVSYNSTSSQINYTIWNEGYKEVRHVVLSMDLYGDGNNLLGSYTTSPVSIQSGSYVSSSIFTGNFSKTSYSVEVTGVSWDIDD